MAIPSIDKKEKVKPILIFCLIIFSVGLISALIYAPSWPAAMTTVEWILACLVSGIFIGFLFGIPKVVQPASKGTTEATKNYQQQVNNNLSEISDWLTKIIVGLGLVNLTKIPPYLSSIANILASGLDKGIKTETPSSIAFAYGIIICYFVVGFLFGYLITRLYLAPKISEADKLAISDLEDKLNNTLAKVENIETGQSMLTQSIVQNAASVVPADKQAKLDSLVTQAQNYMALSSADYGERVRLKEVAASDMAAFVLANQISKTDILRLYASTPSEGLIITLAISVITQPEAGDLDLLLTYANKVTRKHVQYRILNAISKLIMQKLVKTTDKDRILELTNSYRIGADASLTQKIESVVALVSSYTG